MTRALEDVADLIRVELGQTFPDEPFTVEADIHAKVGPTIYVGWYDRPHESGVRAACMRAKDVLTPEERTFKTLHRHRFSKHVRSLAGEVIRREIPDFDFLTLDGFTDQDSQYYYQPPRHITHVWVNGERWELKSWTSTLSLVHRVCWLIVDANPEIPRRMHMTEQKPKKDPNDEELTRPQKAARDAIEAGGGPSGNAPAKPAPTPDTP